MSSSNRSKLLDVSLSKDYYPAEDMPAYVEKLLERAKKQEVAVRTDLESGMIVVVLEGIYASMRVIYLVTEGGKAVCTGIPSVNGVPFFKIDERYLLKTSYILPIGDIEIPSEIEETKREYALVEENHNDLPVHAQILEIVKKEKYLKKYLETPYSR